MTSPSILTTIGQRPCYFISPHLDDAVLSAGGLIEDLARETSVTIITVFTEAHDRNQTLSAKQFLNASGYSSATSFMNDRRKEDTSLLKGIHVSTLHLNHLDAIWRMYPKPSRGASMLGAIIPECLHLYPTYRFHIASRRISKFDAQLISTVRKELKSRITGKDPVVFAPIGIGHIDHTIVNTALGNFRDVYYWLDQPYAYRKCDTSVLTEYKKSFEYSFNEARKERLLRKYKTQINQLFSGGVVPRLSEIFFTKL